MSFFDDDEETAARPATRTPRPRSAAAGSARRPRPRRPQGGGGSGSDQHTLMVRRRIAAGVAVVVLIVIVLLISSLKASEKTSALKTYNHEVSRLAEESDNQVSHPLFGALIDSSTKSALDVELQIDQLSKLAHEIDERAKALSAPGEMTEAQRNLLLVFGLRAEGMAKLALLVPKALGGQAKQTSTTIAGDMELFLASDVVYSQRVAPLIQEALKSSGISGLSTTPTRFIPNIGWLETNTTFARITGQASTTGTSQNGIAPGTHGSALIGVAVGTKTLEAEPALNHIAGGSNPTFTVTGENAGSNPETDVKVDITVTAADKQYKESHVVDSTSPGSKFNVEIPVTGIPTGVAAKVEAFIEGVPGETNLENNKATFLAIFGE